MQALKDVFDNKKNASKNDYTGLLAECLIGIGISENTECHAEHYTYPHEVGKIKNFNKIRLDYPTKFEGFLEYVEIPTCWGANLISIKNGWAHLVEAATGKYDPSEAIKIGAAQ